jgi:hypothetical protein
MKQIILNGTYIVQLMKNENGEFTSALFLKKEKDGVTPAFDFPIKTLQDNESLGLELEFNSEQVFINN